MRIPLNLSDVTPREPGFQSPKALLMLPRSFSASVTPRQIIVVSRLL
jgi:hypothetical protein